jgi:hypothetical protein
LPKCRSTISARHITCRPLHPRRRRTQPLAPLQARQPRRRRTQPLAPLQARQPQRRPGQGYHAHEQPIHRLSGRRKLQRLDLPAQVAVAVVRVPRRRQRNRRRRNRRQATAAINKAARRSLHRHGIRCLKGLVKEAQSAS